MQNLDKIKKTELETLKTFDEEIPSHLFSHTDSNAFKDYLNNYEKFYINNLKFPPQMFSNMDLIDFGSGAGSNSICLATWGAKCTLVELSKKSLLIAKEVFKKHSTNFESHRFINSSIFDFNEENLYDIVHCRAVLSHTAAKEKAFKKMCKLVKKNGYFIYGDPNKAGGFQNMLQRYLIYKFSQNNEEIVRNSELFFKNDIDRSQKAVDRTRKQIIYDRWVIQSQDDPSFQEICTWIYQSGLKLYSTYPSNPNFFITDSFYNQNKIDFGKINNLSILSEILWMMKIEDDKDFVPYLEKDLNELNQSFTQLTSYVANCNKQTDINSKDFNDLSETLVNCLNNLNFINDLKNKFINFISESKKFIEIVNNGNINEAKKFVDNSSFLFKGPCGIRHIDFIAYKEK
tara:strand:- start:15199 stop:16404 length:1206 start_codon:yes stop_codon:yes gene_type:complete